MNRVPSGLISRAPDAAPNQPGTLVGFIAEWFTHRNSWIAVVVPGYVVARDYSKAEGCGRSPALIDQRGDRPLPTHRIRLHFDSSATHHVFNMLIARAAMAMMVTSEIVLSTIIINLAREVSGRTSVGLKAVEVQKARNR